jgi:hypothetical protein
MYRELINQDNNEADINQDYHGENKQFNNSNNHQDNKQLEIFSPIYRTLVISTNSTVTIDYLYADSTIDCTSIPLILGRYGKLLFRDITIEGQGTIYLSIYLSIYISI